MINPWFKFYGSEFLSDPKISSLTASERSCWITLLCLASTSSTPGKIEFLTKEALLKRSGIEKSLDFPDEWNNTIDVLKVFEKMNMVTIDSNGAICINNWKKRQESALTNAERQAKYRLNRNSNEKVTRVTTKVTLEKNRIEKNRIENTSSVADATLFSFEEELSKLKESTRKDFKIIALYWTKKKFKFENKKQFDSALRRELRASKELTGYSGEQIARAIKYCQDNYEKVGWTLETINKRISDVVIK